VVLGPTVGNKMHRQHTWLEFQWSRVPERMEKAFENAFETDFEPTSKQHYTSIEKQWNII
jgi:hypothetical protein